MIETEREELIRRSVDHQQVCPFKGRSDPDFNTILGLIRKLSKEACYDPCA